MTTTAPNPEKLRELDEDERQAWRDYHSQLQELSGPEYEAAEPESWELLQEELRHVERQRILLKVNAAG